ncbi:hypothetical protein WA026_009404 [Henosepilachna vigintioctopunctata]
MLNRPCLSIIFLLPFPLVLPISLKQTQPEAQKNNHRNISIILDNLLRGYDNSVRPDFGGSPAVVEVDIMVRSMGPISEVDMTYSMDCYFRQTWVDRRLAFPGNASDTLALSISMLGRIWKPDTYFYNGKHSYLHTITTPNKFVRLYQNGRVLYSSRLTIKAGCPMNLEDFPMDIQRCPLKFGSFGYTAKDLIYKWNDIRQVATAEDMKLSQFDLIATPAANRTDPLSNSDSQAAKYSMLLVSFHLQRHMGNFLIQVYGPCVLLVVLSWVSFWLNREATADRVSLGITTILTMTFLGLEARTDLPKVPYPTALDFFVFLAFTFIFATIIQFAVVHYFTKYGSGECYFSADLSSDSDSEDEDWASLETTEYIAREAPDNLRLPSAKRTSNCNDPNFIEVIPLSACSVPMTSRRRPSRQSWSRLSACLRRNGDANTNVALPEETAPPDVEASRRSPQTGVAGRHPKRRRKKRTPRFNSVSKIDRASRIVFPLLFVTINMFYWYFYLSRTKRFRNLTDS